jgi:translation initiation factor IF-1
MVKNTQGGNKSKGFARKNLTQKTTVSLRVAKEDGEIYAQAVKVMGGSIVSVIDIDGKPMRAHIRGKFRGRGKRENFIGPGTWLLVGLHSWEGEKSKDDMRNCDILEVYDESDKMNLKNSITYINWNKFILNDAKTTVVSSSNQTDDDNDAGFDFEDGAVSEYEKMIMESGSIDSKNVVIDDDGTQINVDDI